LIVGCAFHVYHTLKIGNRAIVDVAVCSSNFDPVVALACEVLYDFAASHGTHIKLRHMVCEKMMFPPGDTEIRPGPEPSRASRINSFSAAGLVDGTRPSLFPCLPRSQSLTFDPGGSILGPRAFYSSADLGTDESNVHVIVSPAPDSASPPVPISSIHEHSHSVESPRAAALSMNAHASDRA